MFQGRPVCQIIDEQERVNLGQAQEQQQREPDQAAIGWRYNPMPKRKSSTALNALCLQR